MAEIIKPAPKKPNIGFIQKFLRRRVGKEPLEVPADVVKNLTDPKAKLDFHRRILTTGSTFDASRLAKVLSDALTTSYWRRTFYRECELCSSSPIVSAALNVYVDAVTAISGLRNQHPDASHQWHRQRGMLHHVAVVRPLLLQQEWTDATQLQWGRHTAPRALDLGIDFGDFAGG